MRTLLAALLLLVAPTALAADQAWLVEDHTSTRFPDADTPGPELDQGDQVTVVLRDGTRVRVMKGSRFGWVPASVLTDTPPEPAEADDTGEAPQFDVESIRRTLEMGQDLPPPSGPDAGN